MSSRARKPQSSNSDSDMPYESLGEYEFRRDSMLGHGAFALVFKGRHKENKSKEIAVKIIAKKALPKSETLLAKEIKILKELSALRHDNLVQLWDCKETSREVFLIMEFCNGGDLADYLNAEGSLSEETLRLFLRQLADAMKAMNDKGVVHRDLKPQNILLSFHYTPTTGTQTKKGREPIIYPHPSEIILKIADFGFARFLDEGVMAATLCGSPMYMAPEVIMSLQYDAKADLWSLGTIVYQCLLSKAPFHAPTPQALKSIYEKSHNLMPDLPSSLSPEMHNLLSGLLKRNAAERMEFKDFFTHPFLTTKPKLRSPIIPVPVSAISAKSRSSPKDIGGARAPLIRHTPKEAISPVMASPRSGGSSSSEEHDFVMVHLPQDYPKEGARLPSLPAERISPTAHFSIGGAVTYKASLPSSPSPLPSPPRPCYLPVAHKENKTEVTVGRSPPTHSQPVPVPKQRETYNQIMNSLTGSSDQKDSSLEVSQDLSGSPISPTNIPRSEPISMQRTDSRDRERSRFGSARDLHSLSPPALQFHKGTPPSLGRRRTYSGSSSFGTPPSVWHVSPSAAYNLGGSRFCPGSPLRRSGHMSRPNPIGPLLAATAPQLSLPSILDTSPPSLMDLDNATVAVHDGCGNPILSVAGRAMTLPELTKSNMSAMSVESVRRSTTEAQLGGDSLQGLSKAFGTGNITVHYNYANRLIAGYGGGLQHHRGSLTGAEEAMFPIGTSPPGMEPVEFIAPELTEETISSREHSETVAKLNFGLVLVDCIIELAKTKSSPLACLTESTASFRRENTASGGLCSEVIGRAEQLMLYVRALGLLSSSLGLAKDEMAARRLKASIKVKEVVGYLNNRFRYCINICKQLNTSGLLMPEGGLHPAVAEINADQILYEYALDVCRHAAMEDVYGNPQNSFIPYQTGQILLHFLAQQVDEPERKGLICVKNVVESRLLNLQQEGHPMYQT